LCTAHLLGEDLYNALKEHLFEHVQSIRGKLENYTGDELLKEYIEEWTQFKDGAQRNARMLTYLNRHWVVRVLDEGNQEGAHEILPLHTVLWEEVVLDVSQDIVREELLRLVERRRKGDSVDEKIVGDLLAASRKSFIPSSSKKGEGIVLMRTAVDEKDSTKRVPDVYQLLLQTTPDHNTDTTDQAILFRATQLGYVPTVSYLLGLGLKVDIEDATGRTSLSHAAQSQYIDLLKFLLSHSASPNAQDKEGLAPLHWASKFSDHPHHYSTSKAKAIKVLLEHGADPMLKDRRGKTALAWAKQAQSDNTGALFLLKRAMEGKGISGMDNEEKITT
jgi:hypothetical protein